MSATPARIGFVMQAVRVATAETPEMAERYGQLARRDDEPVESFFDDPAHAQLMAEARQTLFGTERRRFNATARGLEQALALDAAGPALPEASYVDEQRAIDRAVVVAEIGFDFAKQQASFVVWG